MPIACPKEFYYNIHKYVDEKTDRRKEGGFVCLFVGCLTSQQHASVSQGPICSNLHAAALR